VSDSRAVQRLCAWLLAASLALPAAGACAAASGREASIGLAAQADRVAHHIRHAQTLTDPAARTAALLEAADAAGAAASGLDPQNPVWQRLQIDRLYALSLAEKHVAAVQVYDAVRTAGHAIPGYATPGAARSLFAEGRVAEGERLLLALAAENPLDPAPLIQLAYLLEAHGRADDARRHLETWQRATAGRAEVSEHDSLDVRLLLARLDRWRGALDASERRLSSLEAAYPDHPGILVEYAALQRQRAKPRAALARLQGLADEDAREVAAHAWLDLGRPDRAAALVDPVVHPELQHRIQGQRASRGWLTLEHANTQSPAITSPSGSRETTVSARADSPVLAGRWRIGAQAANRRAEFQAQVPEARYAGLRTVVHGSGGESSVEVGRTFDDFLERNYAIVDSGYWVRDEIRLAARLALDDPEGPLQARASAIGVDSLSLAATYRPRPEWRLDVGLGGARFDDGNRREFTSLTGERWLRVRGSTLTTGFATVYAGRNSLDDAPYFNPRTHTTGELGLVHGFPAFLRTHHRLRPSVAYFRQDGFGGAVIPLLSYSVRTAAGGSRWLQWDFGAARPVYDGQRETRLSVALSYGWGG
jgi:biofilm PGA synthesis protein PgaA